MTVDLTGQVVVSVACDRALEVVTTDGWRITVENEYELAGADGSLLTTAGGEEERIVAALTAAVGTPLASFSCTDDGHLRFATVGGEVRVAPHPAYESWNVVGPDHQRVVALPGGELAVWS